MPMMRVKSLTKIDTKTYREGEIHNMDPAEAELFLTYGWGELTSEADVQAKAAPEEHVLDIQDAYTEVDIGFFGKVLRIFGKTK